MRFLHEKNGKRGTTERAKWGSSLLASLSTLPRALIACLSYTAPFTSPLKLLSTMVTPSTGPANLHRPSTFEDSTGDSARREEGLAQEGSEAGAESPENSLDTNSNASGAESAENQVAQAREEDQHFRFRPFATPFDQVRLPHPFSTPLRQPRTDSCRPLQSGVETSSTSGPFSDSAPAELDAPWSQQEVDMMALSYAIRAKEKWWEKRKDSGIREKWKREALAAAASTEEGLVAGAEGEEEEETRPRLTEKMVEYVLDELELHEKRLSDPDGIRVSLSPLLPPISSPSLSRSVKSVLRRLTRPKRRTLASPPSSIPTPSSLPHSAPLSSPTSPTSKQNLRSASPTGTPAATS